MQVAEKPLFEKDSMNIPLKVGDNLLNSNLLLAPLAGFTDIAFRRLCRDFGAGLTATEMVSVRGLCHGNEKTKTLLQLSDGESPSCVQLFGCQPQDFTIALQSPILSNFDMIDINMGCPMPKITSNGDGSALMKAPQRAAQIVEACAKTGRTVTVKVRLGIENGKNAVSFCRMLESAGASLVTVHGRTAKQMYTGSADWDAIGTIAAVLTIPVVGNGDITTRFDIDYKLKTYPVAGLMLGRGALGNPQIFSRGQEFGRILNKELMLRHLAYALQYFSERYTVTSLRKHFVWYLKGIPDTKELKAALVRAESAEQIRALLETLNE